MATPLLSHKNSSSLPSAFSEQQDLLSTPNTKETLEGMAQHFVYTEQEFAVVRFLVKGQSIPIVVVGALSHMRVLETWQLQGEWEKHPQYGERFRVQFALPTMPETLLGVEQYLTTLQGLGPEFSRRLVAAFGIRALEVLENEPWRVAQIKGIGKRRVQKAAVDAKNRRDERELMVFLQGYGISAAYAARVQKTYGATALVKIRENPYRLAKEVSGIGFKLADQMAQNMGIPKDSAFRVEAGLIYLLDRASDSGHCYLPKEELCRQAIELLQLQSQQDGSDVMVSAEKQVLAVLKQLAQVQTVIVEGETVSPRFIFQAEQEMVRRIWELQKSSARVISFSKAQEAILAKGQLQALKLVSTSPITIITGGPGTGKTTIIKTLVEAFEKAGKKVALLAPTGRAAKRLSESTGRDAATLHRALEWNPAERTPYRKNQLEASLIVCDEASMLDIFSANALVQAVPTGASLLFVGDVDQLPSVGPGRVLGDLIASKIIPVAYLDEVFRQQEGSGIIQSARRILEGEIPISSDRVEGDFFFIPANEQEHIQKIIVKLCVERIPERFSLDPIRDIQILTPMHRGFVGTESLNQVLQKALNPRIQQKENNVSRGTVVFSVGDKVMQVRNDYERDVWNGDIGTVQEADEEEKELLVSFDDRLVRYCTEHLDQIELAYAISVHKSQGSEYPAIIMPLVMQHAPLLQRNLLYTGVTRGKRLVVLVGSQRALQRAVQEQNSLSRYTQLAKRLSHLG